EEQYRIWAIVRYMKASTVDNRTVFDVGVAFIGKRPPASYEDEPWKRYDISTSSFEALKTPEDMLTPFPATDQRVHTHHNIALDMRIEIDEPNGGVMQTEHTMTENISYKGATLFTTLE